MEFYIYTDGASRGNPGASASGYLVLDSSKKEILREVLYNGKKTNNFAEYMAIIYALEKVKELYGLDNDLIITSDSELVIKQINGLYKVKDKYLKVLNRRVKELSSKFKSCKFLNVRRENRYISIVDRELNMFLDRISDNNLKDKSNYYKQSGLKL